MITALAGGVGGAKLASGLARVLDATQLSVIVNTGDDFELFGLRISPDIDTVVYTLAGLANPETGWGVRGDTFAALDMLGMYGEDKWFQIGDQDFATHIYRSQRLHAGMTLTQVTAGMARSLGVHANILPMCDEIVATRVSTPNGELAFQDYFVRRHHTDDVLGVTFSGIDRAKVTDAVSSALEHADTVVLCPSNPIVSIGPILAVPGIRERIRGARVPVVAVSPIVGGRALRGPADHMLKSLGMDSSCVAVAAMYKDLIDGFVIDIADQSLAATIQQMGLRVLVTRTIMATVEDRQELAQAVLEFAHDIGQTGTTV